MTAHDEILRLDRAHVWHPYTSVDVWERASPLVVARAQGSSLFDIDGRRFLDGNSSWWVAALGHAHPRLVKVLRDALRRPRRRVPRRHARPDEPRRGRGLPPSVPGRALRRGARRTSCASARSSRACSRWRPRS